MVLRCITAKVSKGSVAHISFHFNRSRERVANGLDRKFPGSPEVECGFVYITQFENYSITFIKKFFFRISGIPVEARLNL